jgi:hypothetical protein
MPVLIAANLLAAVMSAQAASDAPVPAVDTAWTEYHLAAAAQPGDPLSDFVLANGLSIQLMRAPDAAAPLPESLRQHMAAERDRLMARADAALMDDAAQLALRLSCGENAPEREHCDARRQRLAELDPDDAHTAMALMSAAWSRKDDAGFLAAAALGARANNYTPVTTQVFASLKRRFEAIPDVAVPGIPRQQDGLPVAGVAAMAQTAAVAMPAYQHFSRPCRESEGELRVHCAAIARRLLDSDVAALDALIGAGVLQAIGGEDDRLAAAKRKRQVDWLVQQLIASESAPQPQSLAERERYFATYAERGELPAIRELLRARGIPVEPPEDWAASPVAP